MTVELPKRTRRFASSATLRRSSFRSRHFPRRARRHLRTHGATPTTRSTRPDSRTYVADNLTDDLETVRFDDGFELAVSVHELAVDRG
ncbi:hypothetical protein AB7C87_00370 [Natrarchaeobius sp. A-rgal3]|uniref:hypothetical protein n=1 Tax=Natrarchaeobius versutus TaxID=1679078 RepID=UPI0035102703